MDTLVRTPQQIFGLSQHLNVPLYQRRYVWDESEQWEPLWADVRRTTEVRLSGKAAADHFLGAIVLQSMDQRPGQVQQWSVVDGQQRLTTLQLLMDSAAAELEDRGLQRLANRLGKLTHNDEDDIAHPDDALKIRHSNGDHAPFVEVMEAPSPVDHETMSDPTSRLVRAHAYFTGQVRGWLEAESDHLTVRAEALVDTLRSGLQIVTITLKSDEDSQEIFETLNARGTPLTAADLIKNLLFQRLSAEGESGATAYRDYWRLFETPFWEKEVSVGRLLQPRSAIFLLQWLISRTGEDIGTRAFFGRFKSFVEHEWAGSTISLLRLLHDQARTYEEWSRDAHGKNPDIGQVALAVYRMDSAQLQVAKPLLIWLHEPDQPKPAQEVRTAVAAVESWLMRRMVMRLPTSDLGRVVANLIAGLRGGDPTGLGSRVQDLLARERTASTYWPGDADVRAALAELPAYRAYGRARLRMMLEAVEDAQRGFAAGGRARAGSRIPRDQMHIEHLLPRSWKRHWPVPDLAAEIARNEHVHRLGNLTLLTRTLNGEVSNGPWAGAAGKRAALLNHDVCLMTRAVRQGHAEDWTEADIDARTGLLIDALLATWPVPPGHEGHVDQPVVAGASVSVAQLVAAGLLMPGAELSPRDPGLPRALVTEQGRLVIDGREIDSPSGAARALIGHAANGWYFWRLTDGRRLKDLRDDYLRADDQRAGPRHAPAAEGARR